MIEGSMSDEDREILEAAVMAHRWASDLCQPGGEGETCAWYHGAWPFLRVLKVMATSSVHGTFYDVEVQRMATDSGFGRVLITGSADFAMLKLVADAWRAFADPPGFTVLDICSTPLELCRWYGARHGLRVDVLRQDILDPLPAGCFDAVFTHAFMGNFDERHRKRLVEQWARVLRPGGRLITVQRVREGFSGDRVGFTESEAGQFVARVRSLLDQAHIDVLSGYDVIDMARTYARNFHSFPVRSAESLRRLFIDAGFRLDRFEQTASTGMARVTGPSVPNTNGYHLISATRL
jgi:SAM-dependent methyltransferase